MMEYHNDNRLLTAVEWETEDRQALNPDPTVSGFCWVADVNRWCGDALSGYEVVPKDSRWYFWCRFDVVTRWYQRVPGGSFAEFCANAVAFLCTVEV